MTPLRRLTKETILYAVGTFFQRIGLLFLVPIYTSALTVHEFGAFETLAASVRALSVLISFGLGIALVRFYSECKDEVEVGVMVRTSSVLVLGISFALLFFLLPFLRDITLALFRDETFGRFMIMALVWAIGTALNQQLLAYYRARRDARTYVAISIGLFLALVALNTYLVRSLGLGLLGVLLGNLMVVWGLNLWMATKFWRAGRSISGKWARKLLGFGIPLVFAMLGWLILNLADRYFLAYYHELSEVAIYSLGYRVGLIAVMIIVLPFQLAWGPFVFARAAALAEEANHAFSQVLTYLLLAYSLLALALFIFASEIVSLLGSGKFPEAAEVVPYILIAYAFNGIYYWVASFFHLRRKTRLLSVIVLVMAALTLLLNWAWIPTWGWVGAAVSTIITIGGTGLLALLVGLRLYKVPLQGVRLGKLAGSVLVVITAYAMLPIPAGVLGFVARGSMLLLLPLTLFLTGFFEPSEIKAILSLPNRFERELTGERT